MITYQELKNNKDVAEYIRKADESLLALGYTEHSFAHVCKVADSVEYILKTLYLNIYSIKNLYLLYYRYNPIKTRQLTQFYYRNQTEVSTVLY